MKCKRKPCHNEVTQKHMTYCSRECAPYGNYGIDEPRLPNQNIREKPIRMSESTKPIGMSEAMFKARKKASS